MLKLLMDGKEGHINLQIKSFSSFGVEMKSARFSIYQNHTKTKTWMNKEIF